MRVVMAVPLELAVLAVLVVVEAAVQLLGLVQAVAVAAGMVAVVAVLRETPARVVAVAVAVVVH
jgi:hypothetical protein